MSSGSVVFSGGIFRDLAAFAPRFPRAGETVFGHDFLVSFGGKSANQSVACAKLRAAPEEADVAFVGAVGADENGRAYRAHLSAAGVDTAWMVEMDGAHTGVASIFVDSTTGENQIVVVKGASEKISENEIEVCCCCCCCRCCCCCCCSCVYCAVGIPLLYYNCFSSLRPLMPSSHARRWWCAPWRCAQRRCWRRLRKVACLVPPPWSTWRQRRTTRRTRR